MSCLNMSGNESYNTTQSSVLVEQLRGMEVAEEPVDYEKCAVLLCAKCNTVLGDSLGVCGEAKNVKSIICLKVTNDVKVKEKFGVYTTGPLALCTFNKLECGCCHRFVGIRLHSTPQDLSFLRNLFLLRKDVLTCYFLKNCTMVKASKISFETTPLRDRISELKQALEAQLKQVDLLKGMQKERVSSEKKPLQVQGHY